MSPITNANEKLGPHNTSPQSLRQIADDLRAEGWHGFAGTIDQVADERERAISRPAVAVPRDQDDLAAIQILRGEVDSLRSQRDLLDRQNAVMKQQLLDAHGAAKALVQALRPEGEGKQPLKVYVLFGQRIGRYEGEYGLEALAVATEHDAEGNPDYLPEQLQEHKDTKEFSNLAVVTLKVREADIYHALEPKPELPAQVE